MRASTALVCCGSPPCSIWRTYETLQGTSHASWICVRPLARRSSARPRPGWSVVVVVAVAMSEGSTPLAPRNCRISAEEEAWTTALASITLVMALIYSPATYRYARRIGEHKHERNRLKAAKGLARLYVPRGQAEHAVMTALLSRAADAYRDRPGDCKPRTAVHAALCGAAGFAYWPDDPQTVRQRRQRESHTARLEAAAQMIVRRGSERCMNLKCKSFSAARSPYCLTCANSADVQRDHNLALKSIQALWDGALRGSLRRLLLDQGLRAA